MVTEGMLIYSRLVKRRGDAMGFLTGIWYGGSRVEPVGAAVYLHVAGVRIELQAPQLVLGELEN